MMRDYDIQWGVVSIPAGSAFTPFTIYKLGSCMLNIMIRRIYFAKGKKEIHSCESNSEQSSAYNILKRLYFDALMQ